MNRELKRVTFVALRMFLALFVSSTIIQYVQAESLAADPRNSRTLYASYSVERGPILVGGDPIAYSEPSVDDYKFQRVYSNGPLYGAVTGYFPVNGEATGLERSLNDELSGRSGSQFFESLNRLISGQDPMGASVEVAIPVPIVDVLGVQQAQRGCETQRVERLPSELGLETVIASARGIVREEDVGQRIPRVHLEG